jgi:hypothetical protein
LYVAADGPRPNNENDVVNCALTRNIVVDGIDWPCEINTLFRDENLGCGKAVSKAISWFFDNVSEGIILEDDCLPDQSFFPYCTELLEKYRDDVDVFTISGSNLLGTTRKVEGQSYFWGQGGIWGWASWKRAWSCYDYKMQRWNEDSIKSKIRQGLQTEKWYQFYLPMFDATYDGSLNTWDVQWLFSILLNEGLSINPRVNLVKNIGFGIGATHTEITSSPFENLPIGTLVFPLKHPVNKKIDVKQLKSTYNYIHNIKSENIIYYLNKIKTLIYDKKNS